MAPGRFVPADRKNVPCLQKLTEKVQKSCHVSIAELRKGTGVSVSKNFCVDCIKVSTHAL